MSTSAPSTVDDQSFQDGARAQKIERLLTVFEAHVAAVIGRQGAFHPVTDLDDARLVSDAAKATLKGERCTLTIHGRTKDAYRFWNDIADLAHLPSTRYPSVPTVRALVRRCELRVKDIEETPDPLAIAG